MSKTAEWYRSDFCIIMSHITMHFTLPHYKVYPCQNKQGRNPLPFLRTPRTIQPLLIHFGINHYFLRQSSVPPISPRNQIPLPPLLVQVHHRRRILPPLVLILQLGQFHLDLLPVLEGHLASS
jgi:hypothetical protein